MTQGILTRLSKDGYFEVNDELAGIVPMASSSEQAALASDIYENGQREPIVLWHGEVVDGRCRMKALKANSMNTMYKELDDELTEEEVKIFVKSVNTRRNLTTTQKVMIAAFESMKSNSKSVAVIAKSWGLGKGSVDNARYIIKQDEKIANALFDGKSVEIVNKKGEEVTSNKVTAVYAYLKKLEENVVPPEDEHAWSANGYIKTQLGREWFYSEMRRLKLKENVEAQKVLAELANYKFIETKV